MYISLIIYGKMALIQDFSIFIHMISLKIAEIQKLYLFVLRFNIF